MCCFAHCHYLGKPSKTPCFPQSPREARVSSSRQTPSERPVVYVAGVPLQQLTHCASPYCRVIYSVFVMHRRKDLWGPDGTNSFAFDRLAGQSLTHISYSYFSAPAP